MVTTRVTSFRGLFTSLVLILIPLACKNPSPVAPTSPLPLVIPAASATSSVSSRLPAVVYAQWDIAQKNLEAYVGDRAYAVSPDMFRWIEHPGKFSCPPIDEPLFNGCFHPDGIGGPRIEWDRTAPSILHHEGGHAILWTLKDPRWDCYEHDDPALGNYEPACSSGVRQ